MAVPPSDDAPWWTSRRTVLAAGLVLGIVLLAVFLALRGHSGAGAGVPPVPGGSSGSAGPSGSQDVGGQDSTVPRTTPAAAWQVYKTVALPVSQAAGPRTLEGDLATGYAHTPTGALVAATQLSVRYVLADDWRAVLDRSIAPGPGRDAWAATRAKWGSLASPVPGKYCQSAGFVYVDYTPSRAVIQLADRCPAGQLQTTTITVAWQGGDWKLVLQPDGSPSPTRQTITSLDGYVLWGGV